MEENYKDLIRESFEERKILLVGAGGIGCEIVKSIQGLPLAEIHIIDLDNIELSNLNRQFYF